MARVTGSFVLLGLLATVLVARIELGHALQCYVCNSIDDAECASKVKDDQKMTCGPPTTTTTASETSSTTAATSETSSTTAETGETSSTTAATGETTPSTVSTTPSTVSTTPSTVSTTPSTVSTTPSTVSTTPSTVSTTPSTVSTTPSTVSTTPSTVSTTPSTVSTTPSTVSTTPSTVSTTPSTVSTTPSTVSTTPSTVATDAGSNNVGSRLKRNVQHRFARAIFPRADEPEYVCVKASGKVDDKEITVRGCALKKDNVCENPPQIDGKQLSDVKCKACEEDGCNSSSSLALGLTSLLLPLAIMLWSK